jgi:hypothetical protein
MPSTWGGVIWINGSNILSLRRSLKQEIADQTSRGPDDVAVDYCWSAAIRALGSAGELGAADASTRG